MNKSLNQWLATLALTALTTASAPAAELVWIGGTGNWNAAGNWSPAQIPTAADNAWITNNGTYAVTIPAGSTATAASVAIGGASGTQDLAIDRATLTIGGASVVNPNGHVDFLVAQSVLTGGGNLTVNGTLNWANGTMSGAGSTSVGANGLVSIGSGGVTFGRTLNNSGTVTWSGGNLTMSAGVALNNLATGTFDITADGRLMGASTTPIDNSGLFRQSAGSAGTVVTAPFNNSGTLNVFASTLNLNLGGTHSGTFSNAAGATISFGGGNHVLTASSLVTGSGTMGLSGNTTTLNAGGNFDAGTTLSVSAGVVSLASGCNVTGTTLNVNSGVLLFNSSGTVSLVNLSGGTLGGTSPLTVTGLMSLGGGTITNALVTANGGLNISGNTILNGTKLINPGTAIWSAGNFSGANGAVFSNLVSATFINTFDGNIGTGAGVTPLFVNAGTFQKTNGTAAAGVTSIDFQFINTGTVEVQTNTLRYAINQQTAGLTLLDGGNLSAQAQPIQLLGGSLIGAGSISVANAQNVINSAVLSPGSPIGELDISGNYQQTASGALNIDVGGYTPGGGFDLIAVSAGGAGGAATLGGTLNVTLANEFSPTNGATFTFLTASTRVGAFSSFSYPSNDIGMQLVMDATSASIKITNLKPVIATPLADPAPITYGSAFNFQFPANTFTDPDNNLLSYTATGLPPGVSFSSSTRTFSGTPAQAGVYQVNVIATDNGSPGLSVTDTFNITINAATLNVAAQPVSKVYGATDPALTFSVTGLQAGDTAASVLTGSLTRAAGETVAGSPYVIGQGTLAANGNYTISFTGNTFSITPAALTVTADSKSRIYGAADPSFTASFAGFVNSETPAVLGGALTFTRAPGQNVGTYAITPTGLTSGNYAITFVASTLTITRASLSVTADAKTKSYGATDPAFTVSYSGFVNSDSSAALGGTLTFSRALGESAGSYAITPAGLTSGNYTITFNTGTLTITKAALSVTADAKSKVYGAGDPTFTATYVGFVNGDTSAALGGTLTFSRTPGENVGTYTITPAGVTSGNYTITFNTASLTVNKAALSITADAKSKVYGTADPTFTVTYTGLVNGDTSAALGGTLAFTRTPGENVGTYSITPGGLTSGNYTIAFNPALLTITKAALSVTADARIKTYGATDPVFTVSYTGFVNGDTSAALGGTLVLARAPGENAGAYTITPSGLTSGNYGISFNTGTLTISKAALAVTADNKTKTYGKIDPGFTVSYSGFVNGETPAVLGGSLTIVRATGENVGSYAITPSGLTSGNYLITFNAGTLTVTKAALAITPDPKTKAYGATDPTLTVTYTGFVNGETPVVLTGTLSIVRTPGENVGGYVITPGGLSSGNYTFTFNTGTLTINKAILTVTAQSKTKVYGSADPALTFTTSGFQFSDTQASVLSGALTRAVGESVAGSPYAITQGTLVANGNYAINFTGSALAVTSAPLSVTADAKSKVYGAADPTFTVTYSGFVNGETSTVLGGTLTFTRAPGQNVGSYAITPAGQTSANYSIAFNAGTLTVTRAALSVTADSKTKSFGSVDPAFTVSYSGFVNGDTSAALSGTLVLARTPGESVGTYSITPSGLTSVNYNITFNPGTLTITATAPSIQSLTRIDAGHVLITWGSLSNATYRVQFKTDLSATTWTDLPGDVVASGNTASRTDILTLGSRFYRIQVVP